MRANRKPRCCGIAFTLLLVVTSTPPVAASAQISGEIPRHDFFRVTLDHTYKNPVSGRLLLFIAPNSGDASDAKSVDMDMMSPASVYVAAKEVSHLVPGESIDIDADDVVFPRPLSRRRRAVIVLRLFWMYTTATTTKAASPVTCSVRPFQSIYPSPPSLLPSPSHRWFRAAGPACAAARCERRA